MNKAKRAAIFGGTFNPPHIGHLLIGIRAKHVFNLDKVIYVPSRVPPHKKGADIAGAKHRMEMVKLLIRGHNDFFMSDVEIKRGSISYSIDTVKFFLNEFPGKKFYFITGSDAFYHIDTWKDYKKLISLIDFIVYERKGFPKNKVLSKYSGLKNINWLAGDIIPVSASEIRQRAGNGEVCAEETGSDVWEYIEKNNLYKG